MVNINARLPGACGAPTTEQNSLDDRLLKSHINCNLSIGNVCLSDIRRGCGLALASLAPPGRRSEMCECRSAKAGGQEYRRVCRSGCPPSAGHDNDVGGCLTSEAYYYNRLT